MSWYASPAVAWGLCSDSRLLLEAHRPTPEQARELACRAAERALPLYEGEYPDDLRARHALSAARAGEIVAGDEIHSGLLRAIEDIVPGTAAYTAYQVLDTVYHAVSAAIAADIAADLYRDPGERDAAEEDAADAVYFAFRAAFGAHESPTAASLERQRQTEDIREILGNPFGGE